MGVFQILRTSTPDQAPAADSLVPGALAVEMASAAPRLWVGTPAALGYPGNMRLVVDSTGAPFLPLAGGTFDTVTDAGGGIVIPVEDSSWARPGIRMNITDGWGIVINSGPGTAIGNFVCNGADGLEITNNITTSVGAAITIRNTTGPIGLQVTVGAAVATTGIRAQVSSLGQAMVLHSNVGMAGGDGNWLVLQRYIATGTVVVGNNQTLGNIVFQGRADSTPNSPAHTSADVFVSASQGWHMGGAGTQWTFRTTPNDTRAMVNALRIAHNAALTVGMPSGPPVTAAGSVNATGYYQDGVLLEAGGVPDGTVDNQVLAWNDTASEWQPASLDAGVY